MITATNSPRFLIIQTAFIGDVILATALLEQIHAAYPDARLDVLVRKGNEGLLANHPFLNDVLIWHKKGTKYRDLWRLLRTVRAQKYSAILNLQRYGTMGLLTTLSGAKYTLGFDKNPFSRFFTHRVRHRFEPGVHEVDRNKELLNVLEINGDIPGRQPLPHQSVVRPKLYPSSADYDAIRNYQSQPYVCMAPMSVWFTKQYPAERWVELIQALPKQLTVYLLGAPTDTAACEAIRTAAERNETTVNLAGKLSLLQSAALQQGAVMNYVNDSAPLHLCSAMNAPTTAIFCSTVPEFGFGPLADGSRVVQTPEQLDCKPCNLHGRKACPLGHFRCAWGIQVDELAKLTL
ncbi:glycosyltransferase family 9 protein [Spirosoma validum]|uniref:Glycosyltransferase family 9 protein n=1 Tax=Spirosoma validum TaxID=2771355 RepID=A0A927AX33_9BACT|nr:glycosyltransferase family 9 protein [Spirosoma validum]MBD2751350.1 glycosyltransferase family 9 protein [Spirosoma validum]